MIAVAALTTFAVTVVLSPVTIRALRRRELLDRPNERSLHTVPTPRGGGVAPAVAACVGASITAVSSSSRIIALAGTAAAFGLVGLTDDVRSFPARVRLAAQLAIGAVAVLPLVVDIDDDAAVLLLVLVAWVWLVAYVNAFNFMDGINGISAVQVIVAGVAWALVGAWQDQSVVTASGVVIAASAVGFLPFNFPHARVFLGDVGSYFFGAWLAGSALLGVGHGLTPEMAVAPLLLHIVDTGWTLLRRAARRVPLTEPHREHVYQRLVIGGWSHTKTTVVVGGIIVLSSGLGGATMIDRIEIRVLTDLLLAVLMAGYLSLPRWQKLDPWAAAT